MRAGLGSHDRFKVSVFERQSGTYRQLQKVLIALNRPEAALEIAERGRARAFVELLAKRLHSRSPEKTTFPDMQTDARHRQGKGRRPRRILGPAGRCEALRLGSSIPGDAWGFARSTWPPT